MRRINLTLLVIGLSCLLRVAAHPQGNQDHPTQPSSPSQSATVVSSEELKDELPGIQLEMTQIAQAIEAIDARMMSAAASGTSKTALEVHELLESQSVGGTVAIFLNSRSHDARWESALKTGKLYTSLFDKIFEMNKAPVSGSDKTQSISSVTHGFPEVFQLVFLTRRLAELELRCSELQSQSTPNSDLKQLELWHKLREALQNDDQTYLVKVKGLLARAGVSPHELAAEIITEARKTTPTLASSLVEGLAIADSEGNIWKLAEVQGINPDFIAAIECDRRAMKNYLAVGSTAALGWLYACSKHPDGSEILAFSAKTSDVAKSNVPVRNAPLTLDGRPLDAAILRLPKEDLSRQQPAADKADTKAAAEHGQDDAENKTFGVTNVATPRQKIPSWWIRCACPDDHPNAGMVVDGVRWHAPVLQCPNPELRLRELMK
jgi:hypothetical protein